MGIAECGGVTVWVRYWGLPVCETSDQTSEVERGQMCCKL